MSNTTYSRLLMSLAACAMLLASPAALAGELEDAAQAYVGERSYQVAPLEPIERAWSDLLQGDETATVVADRDVSPIEKALLLLDAQEEPLTRTRYLLRYSQRSLDGVPASFVQVERFNLGPAIRLETIEAYGADSVDEPEVFGVGPHVVWRFVTTPSAGSAAALVAAGRMEIEETAAATRSCLGRTCLAFDTLDELADWDEWVQMDEDLARTAYPAIIDIDGQELSPALQALELGIHAGLAEVGDAGITWTIPALPGPETGAPVIALVIDRNLGQEIMSDAALGIALPDKESQERWTRISGGVWADAPMRQLTKASGPLVLRSD